MRLNSAMGYITAYAISITGVLIYLKSETINIGFLWSVIIIGAALLVMHIKWLIGANKANFIDRKISIHYERILQKVTKSNFSKDFFEKYLKNTNLAKEKIPTFFNNWSYLVQVIISIILYLALIISTAIMIKL